MANEAKLSATALKALELLENGEAVYKELAEQVQGLNPAHLKALENRGLVKAEVVVVEVPTVVKRKVKRYALVEKGE